MKTSSNKHRHHETIMLVVLVVNAFVFLYFIYKLNQIESLAQETKAQAQEIFQSIDPQPGKQL